MSAHWVCRDCIGHDNFEQFTIGLFGTTKCEVCNRELEQPPLAYVSNSHFVKAMERRRTMTEHEQLVRDLKKCPSDIYNDISVSDLDLIHMIMGISGEAGELLDAVKKATIYRKPIDVTNIIEELGDLEFYLEGLRQALGLQREYILSKNIEKLRIRYGQKYSDKSAQDRKDKATVLDQAIECDMPMSSKDRHEKYR